MSASEVESLRCLHCYVDIEATPPGCPDPWRTVGSRRVKCFGQVPHKLLPDVELGYSDV